MNKLFLLIIITASIFGCKQIYNPVIDSDNPSIVINGVITDNTTMSKVTITLAETYRQDNREQFVSGAVVKVYDNDGLIYNLPETSGGEYRNPSLKAEPGKTYFLEVITPDGDVYRSETQSLPPKVRMDTIYGEIFKKKFNVVKYAGEFILEKEVLEPYIDLTNSVPEIPKCHFNYKYTIVTILEKSYLLKTLPPFSAISYYSKYQLNTNNQVKKNPLNYLYTEMNEYGLLSSRICYILFIDKYDLNSSTFQYYKEIKEQSEYEGKIFDPIPTQIKGNITCVNNPEKLALGMFQVSNVEQFIYICRISSGTDITFTKKDSINFFMSGQLKPTDF